MSYSKPVSFTKAVLDQAYRDTDGFVYRDSQESYSLRATVEALEKAEAERDALCAALSEAGISHGGTAEGLKQGLSVVARMKAERDTATAWAKTQQDTLAIVTRERDEARAQLADYEPCAHDGRRHRAISDVRKIDAARAELASISEEFGLPPTIRPVEGEIRRMLDGWREARADLLRLRGEFAALGGNHNKMEAQRDEARALYRDAEERYANEVRSHDTTMAERDEARAEVARLQDLHTRCAAFDDQPGPACVALAADSARLREALVTIERTGAPGATIVAQRSDGHSCSWCRGMVTPCPTVTARAALAGTSDEWLRAFARKCVAKAIVMYVTGAKTEMEIVEELFR